MIQNPGRLVALILGLLAVTAGLFLFKHPAFRMGLDLQGGTRLVYRFDFDKAVQEGLISADEDRGELFQQTIGIVQSRVDPTGVIDPVIRQEGADRLVIELPGTAELASVKADAALAGPLATGAVDSIELASEDPEKIALFPGQGLVRIGSEKLRYSGRSGNALQGVQRAADGSAEGAHEAGARVVLVADDAIRSRITSLGELYFRIVANETDLASQGTDLVTERNRLNEWAVAHPGLSISAFNRVSREDGGPHALLHWYPMKLDAGAPPVPEADRAVPVLRPPAEWDFSGDDMEPPSRSQDDLGYPAVAFQFKPAFVTAFHDFTSKYEDRAMAIVLNGQVESAPNIDEPLPGRGIIRGKFTEVEVKNLLTVLRSGSLRLMPVLEYEERVGPTLGADNVARNLWAGLVATLVVAGLMIGYYRLLGAFATVALLCNIALLIGGMSFADATLTLPGIGGIILTIGMALDANILIFDRIREERDRGSNIKQAAKTGFDKALAAIVDSNVTTLIAGLILYNVGTGPVRGFAVTLSIGILTTLFSQLVVTRVLVHYALERGTKEFVIGRWLVDADYRILAKARACFAGSALVVGAGLALFAWLPDVKKLGIQFLGGATVEFHTEEPQSRDHVAELIGRIGGEIGNSEVKPVGDEAAGGGYRTFRVVFKVAEESQTDDATQSFAREIRTAVADILQRGPIEISLQGEGDARRAAIELYFQKEHPQADVAAQLASVGLRDPLLEPDPARPGHWRGSAGAPAGAELEDLRGDVENAFVEKQDSAGTRFELASPISKSSLVGKQVVGELRDNAVLAVLLSMGAILLYIRVRFAEYSYGLAALAALVHDVLFTLGACAVGVWLGFVNSEIDLTMISVFLTIVGYSINDTIVIFDRVRENLPRLGKSLEQTIEISLNQTLSRTILTSTTTFLAVAVMLAFNLGTGNELEGFCYAMLVGMISGVYSTIYIASPVLVWLERRANAKAAGPPAQAA